MTALEPALAAEEVVRGPDLRVSATQMAWKPFFVSLNQPLLIRATGAVRPRGEAVATGPSGIAVPESMRWSYPGAPTIVVDADHRLFDPKLPYQALIGRLCGAGECGPPFLVGSERTLCARPPYDDHLELWINHIVGPRRLLGGSTPLTMDTFDVQTRQGEYRFELSRAPAGACGSTVSRAGAD
jgi:hypothetical protein